MHTNTIPAWNTYYLTHASQLRTHGWTEEASGLRAEDFADDASSAGNVTLAARFNRQAAAHFRNAATWYRQAATVDGGLARDARIADALDWDADKLEACAHGLAA
jgi:hypothetical protein